MAKYINNKIKSGRVAGSVFAVRGGEVIERAYNPYVTNPSTTGQIEARAKFKLASQMAAVLADDLIGFLGSKPNVSQRNMFTKSLFEKGLLTYVGNKAVSDLTRLELTNSALSFGSIGTAANTGSAVEISMYADPLFAVEGSMAYAVVIHPQAEGGFIVTGRAIVPITTPSTLISVATTGAPQNNDRIIVFAMRPDGASAVANYKNIVGDGQNNVNLEVLRNLVKSGYAVSHSRNLVVPAQ